MCALDVIRDDSWWHRLQGRFARSLDFACAFPNIIVLCHFASLSCKTRCVPSRNWQPDSKHHVQFLQWLCLGSQISCEFSEVLSDLVNEAFNQNIDSCCPVLVSVLCFFLVSRSLSFQRLDWIVLRLSWTVLSLAWIFTNFFQLASKTNSLPLRCFCEASCWLHGLCAMGVLRPCCLQHFIKIYTSKQQQHTSCIDFMSSMSRPSHFPKHDACAAFLTALTLCCGLIAELPFLGVIGLVIRALQ